MERPRRSGALTNLVYSQQSLFFVLPVAALLLVLVALLLFLLLLLLLVATFLLLTLLVLLGTLITLLAHVGLRMPRAECRGRGDCVQTGVNVVWQFSNKFVNAPPRMTASACRTGDDTVVSFLVPIRNAVMQAEACDAVIWMNRPGARRKRTATAHRAKTGSGATLPLRQTADPNTH